MKKLLLVCALAVASFTAAHAQTPASTPSQPTTPASTAEIKFEEETFDFGTITEGTQATHEFKFKNTGKGDLQLTNVHASCGCTTPTWTREPIKGGKTGVVKAIYNSTGRPGPFTKQITVNSNATNGTKVVTIKGTVEATAKPADNTPVKEKSMMEK
jgi:opacity protein-like surface antigen